MNQQYAWAVSGIGFIIIIGAAWFLFSASPAVAPEPEQEAEVTYKNATADKITVELPFAGAVVGKQFSVIGKARGPWYFEASFPLQLLDEDGNILWEGPVQANGEWMTTDFVPFNADIVVTADYIGPATLILKNDNPSGLPENDASLSIPIVVEY